jgi:hypothetical protein
MKAYKPKDKIKPPSENSTPTERRVGPILMFLILAFPLFFIWPLFLRGYTPRARALASFWLIISCIPIIMTFVFFAKSIHDFPLLEKILFHPSNASRPTERVGNINHDAGELIKIARRKNANIDKVNTGNVENSEIEIISQEISVIDEIILFHQTHETGKEGLVLINKGGELKESLEIWRRLIFSKKIIKMYEKNLTKVVINTSGNNVTGLDIYSVLMSDEMVMKSNEKMHILSDAKSLGYTSIHYSGGILADQQKKWEFNL